MCVHLPNQLRLGPQCGYPALLIGVNTQGGLEGKQLRPLGHRAFNLFWQGGHILLAAPVHTGHFFSAQANGAPGDVHGHVAASDNHYVLPRKVGHVIITDTAQHLHGGNDAMAVLAWYPGLLVRMGTDREVQAVVFFLQFIKGNICSYRNFSMYLNAQGQDGVDFRVQPLPRETIAGDSIPHHAAQLLLLLIDRNAMTHQSQVVSCR